MGRIRSTGRQTGRKSFSCVATSMKTSIIFCPAYSMIYNPCGAKRKRCRALDSCFGLISPHQQSILHPYLQAPRVYKVEQWRCTCGYEMRFIPTRLCHCYALIRHPSIHGLEPRLCPTPAGQRPVRAETRIQKADMMGWATAMKPASTHTLLAHHMIDNPCGAYYVEVF